MNNSKTITDSTPITYTRYNICIDDYWTYITTWYAENRTEMLLLQFILFSFKKVGLDAG